MTRLGQLIGAAGVVVSAQYQFKSSIAGSVLPTCYHLMEAYLECSCFSPDVNMNCHIIDPSPVGADSFVLAAVNSFITSEEMGFPVPVCGYPFQLAARGLEMDPSVGHTSWVFPEGSGPSRIRRLRQHGRLMREHFDVENQGPGRNLEMGFTGDMCNERPRPSGIQYVECTTLKHGLEQLVEAHNAEDSLNFMFTDVCLGDGGFPCALTCPTLYPRQDPFRVVFSDTFPEITQTYPLAQVRHVQYPFPAYPAFEVSPWAVQLFGLPFVSSVSMFAGERMFEGVEFPLIDIKSAELVDRPYLFLSPNIQKFVARFVKLPRIVELFSPSMRLIECNGCEMSFDAPPLNGSVLFPGTRFRRHGDSYATGRLERLSLPCGPVCDPTPVHAVEFGRILSTMPFLVHLDLGSRPLIFDKATVDWMDARTWLYRNTAGIITLTS